MFEGVCVNYRHPDPRRGEPRVGSAPDVAIPVDPVDPLDPLQNSVRLIFAVKNNVFGQVLRNWGPIFGSNHSKAKGKSMFLASNLKKLRVNQCFWRKKRFFGDPLVKKTLL